MAQTIRIIESTDGLQFTYALIDPRRGTDIEEHELPSAVMHCWLLLQVESSAQRLSVVDPPREHDTDA